MSPRFPTTISRRRLAKYIDERIDLWNFKSNIRASYNKPATVSINEVLQELYLLREQLINTHDHSNRPV